MLWKGPGFQRGTKAGHRLRYQVITVGATCAKRTPLYQDRVSLLGRSPSRESRTWADPDGMVEASTSAGLGTCIATCSKAAPRTGRFARMVLPVQPLICTERRSTLKAAWRAFSKLSSTFVALSTSPPHTRPAPQASPRPSACEGGGRTPGWPQAGASAGRRWYAPVRRLVEVKTARGDHRILPVLAKGPLPRIR